MIIPFTAADSAEKQAAAQDTITSPGSTSAADGGYITREAVSSIRFLTLEDTVIQLTDVAKKSGELTVDASSRIDGGASVTLNGTGSVKALAGTLPIIEGTTINAAGVSLVLTGSANEGLLAADKNTGITEHGDASLQLGQKSIATVQAGGTTAAGAALTASAAEVQATAADVPDNQQKDKKKQ